MTIRIKHGSGVPFVITKTTLQSTPKIRRTSRFLGFKAGIKRLVTHVFVSAIEAVETSFFEKNETKSGGEVVEQTHFAVYVNDEGNEASLEVEQVPFKPGCAHHYEIVKVKDAEAAAGESVMPSYDGPDEVLDRDQFLDLVNKFKGNKVYSTKREDGSNDV